MAVTTPQQDQIPCFYAKSIIGLTCSFCSRRSSFTSGRHDVLLTRHILLQTMMNDEPMMCAIKELGV